MANKLNGFLDNFFGGVTNPKGNLADFKHASRLYVDDTFRLAPKTKFLFYVVFEFSIEASRTMTSLVQKHGRELQMMAKTIELPQYSANVETKNQYNRKKVIQTAIQYTPVSIVLHDDNQGITTQLLEAYYKYYYRDSRIRQSSDDDPQRPFPARPDYTPNDRLYRYGLDNDRNTPFFRSIKLYQLARQDFTEFTLVNPIIERWGHDSLDQSDNTGITENTLVLNYESVLYRRGDIGVDEPAGFADTHYDVTPSPLQVQGGGVGNIFGGGGILDGGSGVLADLASGEAGLGTLISGANTIKNLKTINEQTLTSEGLSIFNNAVVNSSKQTAGGIPGVHFPKDGGPGSASQNTVASGPGAGSTSIPQDVKTQRARGNI